MGQMPSLALRLQERSQLSFPQPQSYDLNRFVSRHTTGQWRHTSSKHRHGKIKIFLEIKEGFVEWMTFQLDPKQLFKLH